MFDAFCFLVSFCFVYVSRLWCCACIHVDMNSHKTCLTQPHLSVPVPRLYVVGTKYLSSENKIISWGNNIISIVTTRPFSLPYQSWRKLFFSVWHWVRQELGFYLTHGICVCPTIFLFVCNIIYNLSNFVFYTELNGRLPIFMIIKQLS